MMKMRNFLSVQDVTEKEITTLIKAALKIKKNPKKFSSRLDEKTLLMLFEAPSLRTRLSFEAGMTQIGGHAIAYHMQESTVGKKESVKDLGEVASRYADLIMARLYSHEMLAELAESSEVPVINGMTNFEHPCQALSDLMTIFENKGKLKGLKLAYLGDGFNNTTHSLLYGCSKMGINISVACPERFSPDKNVVKQSALAAKGRSNVEITTFASAAAKDADIIYTDSWMSYHVPEGQEKMRRKIFMPYQVNRSLMKLAKKDAIFMHCLPAKRGDEVTDDVIDSRQSVVYDQAENRLHTQKALVLWLLGRL